MNFVPSPRILDEVIWDFADKPLYLSEDAFFQAVTNHYIDINEYASEFQAHEFQYQKMIGNLFKITIQYTYDDGSDLVTHSFVLIDLPTPLYEGHLLYRIHNQVVDILRDLAHTHFEGLEFVDPDVDGYPIYEMHLGS